MIAPMKKFLLAILAKDAREAPLYLRKLGIAHIQKFESTGESCSNLEASLKSAKSAKAILTVNASKRAKEAQDTPDTDAALIELVLAEQSALGALQDRQSELKREMDRVGDWGDFSPDSLATLQASGIQVRLLEGLAKKVENLEANVDYVRLSAPKGKARIALIGDSPIPADFEVLKPPALNLASMERELAETETRIAAKKGSLSRLAASLPRIDKKIERIESELAIERMRSGMAEHESIRFLTGYVPAKAFDILKREVSRRGWAIALSDPDDDDLPPTKVENPAPIRIIQPVFNFLGTVPGYREYDISTWFLIFFSLYFAMIFGDGGYGLLMFAGALVATLKMRGQKRPLPDFLKLLYVLSSATILWGLLTGSWFALPFDSLPGFLRLAAIRAFAVNNPESGTNIKIFCFIIGAIQLSLAHLKNIKRDMPNLKFLAQVGSLALVLGMFNAVLNLVVDATRFPLTTPALSLIGGGFLLVLVFGNWNGHLGKSILEGLKGIIPTFLSTVSVFADIVSYIRLWAVSLAGLAISQTVNGMVAKMIGAPGGRILAFFIGLVAACGLLLAGHALNFLMTVLSVVVHGIRLNMLEFSSHLGMEWTGYSYEPLRERAEDNEEQE